MQNQCGPKSGHSETNFKVLTSENAKLMEKDITGS